MGLNAKYSIFIGNKWYFPCCCDTIAMVNKTPNVCYIFNGKTNTNTNTNANAMSAMDFKMWPQFSDKTFRVVIKNTSSSKRGVRNCNQRCHYIQLLMQIKSNYHLGNMIKRFAFTPKICTRTNAQRVSNAHIYSL